MGRPAGGPGWTTAAPGPTVQPVHPRHPDRVPRLLVVMVGLPARGKTSVARRLYRYLSWLGYRTRLFNLGDYRRRVLGGGQGPDFFAPDNVEGVRQRQKMAELALVDVGVWLGEGGHVAIFDATNSTAERRRWLLSRAREMGAQLVFVETLTDDPALIEAAIQEKQLHSPDFAGLPPDAALADFRERLAHYSRVYESIDDPKLPYIQVIDAGRRIIANRIQGYVPTLAATILMNMHLVPRRILLTRHGESRDNAADRIGGDADVTPAGRTYAEALAAWADAEFAAGTDPPLVVWTSTLLRSRRTAAPLAAARPDLPVLEWRALCEIDAGDRDGMTYAEIAARHPDEFAARSADKLRYRYPQGESYMDLIDRLHPAIIDLERLRRPVLVVAHQAVVRCLYAYFTGVPVDAAPHVAVPLHTVIDLTPTSYGCAEVRHTLC